MKHGLILFTGILSLIISCRVNVSNKSCEEKESCQDGSTHNDDGTDGGSRPGGGNGPSTTPRNDSLSDPSWQPPFLPSVMQKDKDGLYGTITSKQVTGKAENPPDTTKPWTMEIQTATSLVALSPGSKYLLLQPWTDFFGAFTLEQYAFQDPRTIVAPPVVRFVNNSYEPLAEFAPDDEPVPRIPSNDNGIYIRDIQVFHNLRLDESGQMGMAVVTRGYAWNLNGQRLAVSGFIVNGGTSLPLTAVKGSAYGDTDGNLQTGVAMNLRGSQVIFQSLFYLPYRTLPVRAADLRIHVQARSGDKVVSNADNQFSIDRTRTEPVPPVGKINESGMTLPSNFSDTSKIHVFMSSGFADCCVPSRIRNTMAADFLTIPVQNARFPNNINLKGWGIKSLFEVEWDTFSTTKPDENIDTWNDRNTRREIERFIAKRPGDTYILFGHSFGGDTMIKIAKCLDGNTALCIEPNLRTGPKPTVFLAVTDPVQTGAVRNTSTIGSIDSDPVIRQFQNYWSKNGDGFSDSILGPVIGGFVELATGNLLRIPLDFFNSGRLDVRNPKIENIQDEQSVVKDFAGVAQRTSCGWLENCPGKQLPACSFKKWKITCRSGNPGTKQVRLHHSEMPDDPFIEKRMIDALCQAKAWTTLRDNPTFVPLQSPCGPQLNP